MNLRIICKKAMVVAAAMLAVVAISGSAQANTFTVKNNCGYTVYPGLYPAVYQNGGWSMAPGATVSFTVASNFNGRIWGRQNCNTASPAVCAAGSCGGTGLQCAGTTGTVGTSLAEFNLNASGTDWYDVSYVDGQDTPLGLTLSTASCYQMTTAGKIACPTAIVNGVDCVSPCTQTGNPQFCCAGAYNSPQTCIVANWPANDQAYNNNIHSSDPGTYAYAYDDNIGLHTCPTGAGNNYTITFCPSGSTTGGTTGTTTGSTTTGSTTGSITGLRTLTPQCATGSRLDDNAAATTNGNKVQIWASNGSAAQQWNLATSGVVPAGDYNLAVNLGPYCLQAAGTTSGSVAQLWSCNGSAGQAWKIVADTTPAGYSQLKPSNNTGLCLDVSGAGTANGTQVLVYTCNNTNAQQWKIQ